MIHVRDIVFHAEKQEKKKNKIRMTLYICINIKQITTYFPEINTLSPSFSSWFKIAIAVT